LCDPEELEDAGDRGVVEDLMPDGLVAANPLTATSDPGQGAEGGCSAHAAIMRASPEAGNQRSSR
jgi:hypothetical protein